MDAATQSETRWNDAILRQFPRSDRHDHVREGHGSLLVLPVVDLLQSVRGVYRKSNSVVGTSGRASIL
jgi:hypothetical protein